MVGKIMETCNVPRSRNALLLRVSYFAGRACLVSTLRPLPLLSVFPGRTRARLHPSWRLSLRAISRLGCVIILRCQLSLTNQLGRVTVTVSGEMYSPRCMSLRLLSR